MPENSPPQHRFWNLKIQRWLIPITLSVLGIGYTYWEVIQLDGYELTSEQAVFGFLLQGFISPIIAFLTLTWALSGLEYWEQAQQESEIQRQHLLELNRMSAAANQELETRVAERTLELERAKQELAEKAEMLSEILAAERRVEEKTRAEIAADLHDGVQQLIVGALYEIQAARDASTQNPQIVPTRLQATQELLRRIGDEMRRAIHSLHPVALDAQGLVPAIRECAERFERVTGISCEFKVEGAPRRFAPEVEVAAFRIAQEALNNAIAHAQAHRVQVALGFGASALSLQVSDDGAGFDVDEIRKRIGAHLGLIGMRERATSVGGSFEIESQPGGGTRIVLCVPFEKSPALAESLMV